MAKGAAIGYSDYFKDSSRTPGSSISISINPNTGDNTEENKPFQSRMPTKAFRNRAKDEEQLSKEEALKRRLKAVKASRGS
jgi:hypothetical protein